MKKLIVLIGVITVGFIVNAASVVWEAYDDSGTSASDLAIYILPGDLSTGSTITSITDVDSAKAYIGTPATGSYGVMDSTDGFYANGSFTYASGSATFYALIFNADSIDDATGYKVIGSYDVVVPGNGSIPVDLDFDGLTSSGYTSFGGVTPPTPGPGDVPEPTSGLLLVLGGAMLALRRRR